MTATMATAGWWVKPLGPRKSVVLAWPATALPSRTWTGTIPSAMTTQLDPRAVERVSGPSWQVLKPAVLEIGETLLRVSTQARSNLTTIYVKFERPNGSVYAVMWIKKSTQAVVGLALPENTAHERLHDAPTGMTYAGLTRYFTVREGDDVPYELAEWGRIAFSNI